jgi:myo-inositol 2-dehydrogenase/D-chiro-inositol 1-dehydrogenase
MSDHQRLEVEDVIEVRWNRNPPFKTDDLAATLADDVDTLTWKPNFTAAANEDHKGYHALLGDAVRLFSGETSAAPTIADGVPAMERLEELRRQVGL